MFPEDVRHLQFGRVHVSKEVYTHPHTHCNKHSKVTHNTTDLCVCGGGYVHM